MGKVKFNFMEFVTGRVDGVVFRKVNDMIIISRRPRYNEEKQTALQKENRDRFRRASTMASYRLRDPEIKAHYQREPERLKLPNAYTAALKEEMSVKEGKAFYANGD